MKTFRKYLEEAAAEELPLAPDDVLNAIERINKLKNDENTPNHVYSFYRLQEWFGNSTGFLFMKTYVDRYIGEKMDVKKISEIMASAKEYQKVAKAWIKETADIVKRYGGKAGLDGKYRTYAGVLRIKHLEEVEVEAKKVLAIVRSGLGFWKALKSIADSRMKRREFRFKDDIVHLYDTAGKEVSKGKFDSLKGGLVQMFNKSVYCENLGLYVLCGPTKESGLPKAQYIMVVEEK